VNPDIVLATVECARWDYREHLQPDADLDTHRGVAAGHYTRPSLAAVHGPTWDSVLDTRVRGPTLAETLSDAGYQTHAISYSPQTTDAFGFGRGFDQTRLCEPDSGPLSRGSAARERLSTSRPGRWLHNQLGGGKRAVFDGIPRDASVAEHARDALRTDEPAFLWIHFMGSHRPYGWDNDAIPERLGQDLADARPRPEWFPKRFGQRDADQLRELVKPYYVSALERISGHLTDLIEYATDDTVWCIAGDHGEELGEEGYFLHAGYRRRVVDTLVNVPVISRGLNVDGPVSLLDIGAHLTDAVGVDAPAAWNTRPDRESFLTVAPWNGKATVRYQDDGVDLRFEHADMTTGTDVDVSPEGENQLEALGYRGAG